METAAALSAVSAAVTSTVKLTEKVFEIRAVDEQARNLLKLINRLNEQLDLAKTIRRRKSGLLTREEKAYMDDTFKGTESAIGHVAELIEPCRVAMKTSNGSIGLRTRLMFTLRDSPRIQVTVTSLGIASQTLNTVVGILFSKEGANNAPLVRSYSDDTNMPPPSYEESNFLTNSRKRNLRRQSSSLSSVASVGSSESKDMDMRSLKSGITDIAEEAEDTESFIDSDTKSIRSEMDELFLATASGETSPRPPPTRLADSYMPYRPGHTSHPALIPGRGLQVKASDSPKGFEGTQRRVSDMPSKTTSSFSSSWMEAPSTNIAQAPPAFTESNVSLLQSIGDATKTATTSPYQTHLQEMSGEGQPPIEEQSNRTSIVMERPTKRDNLPSQVQERVRQSDAAYNAGLPVVSCQPILNMLRDTAPSVTSAPTDGTPRSSFSNYLQDRTYPNISNNESVQSISHTQAPHPNFPVPTTQLDSSKTMSHGKAPAMDFSIEGGPPYPSSRSILRKQLPQRGRTEGEIMIPPEQPGVGISVRNHVLPAPPSSNNPFTGYTHVPGPPQASWTAPELVPRPLFRDTGPIENSNDLHGEERRPNVHNAPLMVSNRSLESEFPEVVVANSQCNPETAPEVYVECSSESAPEVLVHHAPYSPPKATVQRSPEAAPEVVMHHMPESAPAPALYAPYLPESVPGIVLQQSPGPDYSHPAHPIWSTTMPTVDTRPLAASRQVNRPQTVYSMPAFRPELALDPPSPLTGSGSVVSSPRPRTISDVDSVRSLTLTPLPTGDAMPSGRARSQRWREAQYEKFEQLQARKFP